MTETAAPAAAKKAPAKKAPAGTGGRRLVIVESPTKAKKIQGFLGAGYVVESSYGHIRDLPRNAAEVPASHKDKPWAKTGVDVDNGFETLYVVTPESKQQVTRLKQLLKETDELFLATDEDREGEAIAWHLLETLKPKVPVRRMVFHEITPQAIQHAVQTPRELDTSLVQAQETRRVLDRLYGYEVSPVLWKKVMPRLSAGRVQSVATRIVVERERARMRFVEASYWDVEGRFTAAPDETDPTAPRSLTATLVQLDGKRLATGRDFEQETGQLKAGSDVVHLDEASARDLAARLEGRPFAVRAVEDKPYTRKPYAPFMTSTLQQEAGRKLRFSAQRTMQTAQRLYENGYITYMRTDSSSLSETATAAARDQARALYGPEYVPDAPRRYASKSKNAQEAHEAIRPAGEVFRTPGEVARELSGDELRLYELVWQRTVASQMADARGVTATVRLGATTADGADAEFSASGRVITFPGFLRAYVESTDDDGTGDTLGADDSERRLPRVAVGSPLDVDALDPQGHTTSPPARYTEASLVKRLEELGIGRPSTYASIITTIQDRGYVWKKGSALVPTWLAFAVVRLLEEHFGGLVDYGFTASLEDDLDEIAGGRGEAVEWLTRFYFGEPDATRDTPAAGLKRLVGELGDIDARDVNSIVIGRDEQGREVVVRVGRYGPYVQVGDGEDQLRASLPEDLAPDELTVEKAVELASAPSGDRVLGQHPETGYDVVAKAGRYGPYVTVVLPEGSKDKPPTASLFSTMSLDTIDLDTALQLLTLPRVLGTAEDGEEVTAQNGRYGPYISKGKESRSLQSEEQLFTVSLEEALHLLSQPKQRGRQAAAAKPPLKELGTDPASGRPMVVKEGRFGPYVTDGETNASLRKGDDPETLTDERASELLAERRARGPAKKAPAKKAAAKKAPAKKAPATKTAAAKKA